MSAPINSDLIEAHALCRRKAFFLLREHAIVSELELPQVLKQRATENYHRWLERAFGADTAASDQCPNPTACRDRVVELGDLRADCDAISQVDRKSPGSHHRHEPHLVLGTHSITHEQRARIAFAGFVIGQMRRYRPSSGWLVPVSGKPKRVILDSLYPTVRSSIADLRALNEQACTEPPPLILNDHCPSCPFRQQCLDEAQRTDNLTLLERITPKLLKKYHAKGILTLAQLSYIFKPRRRRKRKAAASPSFNVELQALALRTKKVYLDEAPSLPDRPVELFFDIEGVPDENRQYLIGLVVRNANHLSQASFWANTANDERLIFEQFFEAVSKYGDAPLYHYGSYEPKALRRAVRAFGSEYESLLDRLVNVNACIFGKVYFPSRSNRLKDLGALVGAQWDASITSGLQSLGYRYRWEADQDETTKDKLIAYNLSDCHAVRLLVEELRAIGKTAQSRSDVDFADSPKPMSTDQGADIHDAFDRILSSAHETYRRSRIRFRSPATPSNFGERGVGAPKGHPAYVRVVPTKVGTVVSVRRRLKCPSQFHKGQALEPTGKRAQRTVIDLAFPPNGCRKTITKYEGEKAQCPRCQREFLPPAISRLQGRLFGHCFQAWAVYQRVALRLPYTAVSAVVDNLFGERVSPAGIINFVRHLASEYSSTETRLLKRIMASPFIHVDETTLSIRGSQCYVWVITDGSHVVFRLTETREATLIHELFKGYGGVLVSDFYGGYDAVECRQQKCWAHLIRDLNEDLWKNPFQKEFEQFVAAVRNLIVPIFEDVDRFGLKARHLRKHQEHVERFFKRVIDPAGTKDELLQKYHKRFQRHRAALFRFLLEDDIPWNNNTAERAIRHLAIQRKISGSFYRPVALQYLRLLGIAQMCRFQNKSFLHFLLSHEKDVDVYRERRRPRSTQRIDKTNSTRDDVCK